MQINKCPKGSIAVRFESKINTVVIEGMPDGLLYLAEQIKAQAHGSGNIGLCCTLIRRENSSLADDSVEQLQINRLAKPIEIV
jgi:hypothetical protein